MLSYCDSKFVINKVLKNSGTFFFWQNQNVSVTFQTDDNAGVWRRVCGPHAGLAPGRSGPEQRQSRPSWTVKDATDATARLPQSLPDWNNWTVANRLCSSSMHEKLSELFHILLVTPNPPGLWPGGKNKWCEVDVQCGVLKGGHMGDGPGSPTLIRPAMLYFYVSCLGGFSIGLSSDTR